MLAPVMLIGDEVRPRMTPFKVEEALVPYKAETKTEGSNKEKS